MERINQNAFLCVLVAHLPPVLARGLIEVLATAAGADDARALVAVLEVLPARREGRDDRQARADYNNHDEDRLEKRGADHTWVESKLPQ